MNSKKFKRKLLVALLIVVCVSLDQEATATQQATAKSKEPQVAQWTRFETQFTSSAQYENPVQDVQAEVEFTSPSGRTHLVPAFWDGGKNWKIRFSPNEPGRWIYRSRSSPAADQNLNNQRGAFTCIAYTGANPLYRHGAVSRVEDKSYLAHADRTPFLWLGDTAWNGPLKATKKDWDTFLKDRAAKGFNVIKFVTTQYSGALGDSDGRVPYTGKTRIAVNPEFYQRMDERVDAINEHGMVAAPVLLWAHPGQPQLNPGIALAADQMIVLARYMIARYGAHQVIWILNGDGDYRADKAEPWKKIGRAVFATSHPDRLATMHPGQGRWMSDEFGAEPWFSFNSYQSGHRDDEKNLRWFVEGPPSERWKRQPHLPAINLEPSYEAHNSRSVNSKHVFDARDIRRAAYWSLLVAPPAGVSYGAHGVWSWQLEPDEPLNHKGTGIARPWHEAINLPGSSHMKHLKNLFASLEWWTLRPDQDILVEQPGKNLAKQFIAAARSGNGNVGVVYIPEGGRVSLKMDRFKSIASAEWFDPATGTRAAIGAVKNDGTHSFENTRDQDWVLILKEQTKQ